MGRPCGRVLTSSPTGGTCSIISFPIDLSQMLKSVLLEWNKKHERFYLMNVGEDLQRILGAVLPAEVLQLTARGSLSSNCTKISLGAYFCT